MQKLVSSFFLLCFASLPAFSQPYTTSIELEIDGFNQEYYDYIFTLASDEFANGGFAVDEGAPYVTEITIRKSDRANEDSEFEFKFLIEFERIKEPRNERLELVRIEGMASSHQLGMIVNLVAYEIAQLTEKYGPPQGKISSKPTVTLMEATPVELKLLWHLSTSSDLVGDEVRLVVERDVIVDGEVVIQAGQHVEGVVTYSDKPGAGGRGGGIGFVVPMIYSVNGQPVPVANSTTYATGGSGVGGVVVGSLIVGRLALLLRGGHAVIEAGQKYTVYVTKDRDLRIN